MARAGRWGLSAVPAEEGDTEVEAEEASCLLQPGTQVSSGSDLKPRRPPPRDGCARREREACLIREVRVKDSMVPWAREGASTALLLYYSSGPHS